MEIFVTRHGQTDWNVAGRCQGLTDIELNETGIEQAKELADKLKEEKIDVIITSPLKRALRTAQIINENKNCPIIIDEGFIERNLGEYEGKHFTELPSNSWNYIENAKFNNAESAREIIKRVYVALDKVIEKYKGKNVLIVTHGGTAIPINCYFNGIPESGNLKESFHITKCEIKKYSK